MHADRTGIPAPRDPSRWLNLAKSSHLPNPSYVFRGDTANGDDDSDYHDNDHYATIGLNLLTNREAAVRGVRAARRGCCVKEARPPGGGPRVRRQVGLQGRALTVIAPGDDQVVTERHTAARLTLP